MAEINGIPVKCPVYKATITAPGGKVIKEFAVLHPAFDANSKFHRFWEMMSPREREQHEMKMCKYTMNRISSLNWAESQEGEPLFPPGCELSVVPMFQEFDFEEI